MKEVFEIIKEMPPAFWLVMIFCIGAFVGSFLNVVVYRLPRNCLSINNPKRSFCPSCKTQLKWNDNLPIIGWLLLRGKCRYCGVKYGLRYPMVELLTAGLFTFAAWRVVYADGNLADQPMVWLTLLHAILIISVMLPWALIDFDLRMIPDKLTLGPLLVFIPFAADWRALDFGLASLRSTPDTAVAAEPGSASAAGGDEQEPERHEPRHRDGCGARLDGAAPATGRGLRGRGVGRRLGRLFRGLLALVVGRLRLGGRRAREDVGDGREPGLEADLGGVGADDRRELEAAARREGGVLRGRRRAGAFVDVALARRAAPAAADGVLTGDGARPRVTDRVARLEVVRRRGARAVLEAAVVL